MIKFLIVIAFFILFSSCSPNQSSEQVRPVPASSGGRLNAQDGGECRQLDVPEGSLCFLSTLREQLCEACGTREKEYALGYRVGSQDGRWGFMLVRVRIPAKRLKEFELFAARYSPARCSGLIIAPPCNPEATDMKVEVPWPPWAGVRKI